VTRDETITDTDTDTDTDTVTDTAEKKEIGEISKASYGRQHLRIRYNRQINNNIELPYWTKPGIDPRQSAPVQDISNLFDCNDLIAFELILCPVACFRNPG
jgi:hypothetical protein